MSPIEPSGAWRGPAYENYVLDGELVEIAHNAIAAGIRIRSIGRHTVMIDPAKREGLAQAYLTPDEVMAYKST